ncbi:hypothetical protein [Nocardia barduliensis]|uniref:hypothetical protein n=1 Tax=Nocardia barduliensis TaxID=2736643 RepID=UPI001571C891|nr:hypothetical protein [Nocardia barduliensis]
MGTLVTLAEWAKLHDLSPVSVRNHWATREDFPAHKQYRPRVGSGRRHEEYDADELDAWLEQWQTEHRPAEYAMPTDPDEFRTLGAIARLLGVDGKTITQYRTVLDQHADHEDRGKRRMYRTRDVVDVLNRRRGIGRAMDPSKDRRRRAEHSGTTGRTSTADESGTAARVGDI